MLRLLMQIEDLKTFGAISRRSTLCDRRHSSRIIQQ